MESIFGGARNRSGKRLNCYTQHIPSAEEGDQLIRHCFLLTLISAAGAIVSYVLLGVGLYERWLELSTVIISLVVLICFVAGICYYIREVGRALTLVREDGRGSRFKDLGAPPEVRRNGWWFRATHS
jgi:hypothetical protein